MAATLAPSATPSPHENPSKAHRSPPQPAVPSSAPMRSIILARKHQQTWTTSTLLCRLGAALTTTTNYTTMRFIRQATGRTVTPTVCTASSDPSSVARSPDTARADSRSTPSSPLSTKTSPRWERAQIQTPTRCTTSIMSRWNSTTINISTKPPPQTEGSP